MRKARRLGLTFIAFVIGRMFLTAGLTFLLTSVCFGWPTTYARIGIGLAIGLALIFGTVRATPEWGANVTIEALHHSAAIAGLVFLVGLVRWLLARRAVDYATVVPIGLLSAVAVGSWWYVRLRASAARKSARPQA